MEDRIQFDINESLKYYLSDPTSVPTVDADPELLDCETDPDQLSTAQIDNVLNSIVDGVAESPEGLARSSFFDSLQFLLKCVLTLKDAWTPAWTEFTLNWWNLTTDTRPSSLRDLSANF